MNYFKLSAYSALFFSLVLFSPPGCSAISKAWAVSNYSVSQQTSEGLIEAAEKTSLAAKDVFATFLNNEKENRLTYWKISHEIKHKADWLRERVPDPDQIIPGDPPTLLIPRNVAYQKSLRKATRAFKQNRTADGEAGLKAALATIQSAIDDVKRLQGVALSGGKQP